MWREVLPKYSAMVAAAVARVMPVSSISTPKFWFWMLVLISTSPCLWWVGDSLQVILYSFLSICQEVIE